MNASRGCGRDRWDSGEAKPSSTPTYVFSRLNPAAAPAPLDTTVVYRTAQQTNATASHPSSERSHALHALHSTAAAAARYAMHRANRPWSVSDNAAAHPSIYSSPFPFTIDLQAPWPAQRVRRPATCCTAHRRIVRIHAYFLREGAWKTLRRTKTQRSEGARVCVRTGDKLAIPKDCDAKPYATAHPTDAAQQEFGSSFVAAGRGCCGRDKSSRQQIKQQGQARVRMHLRTVLSGSFYCSVSTTVSHRLRLQRRSETPKPTTTP